MATVNECKATVKEGRDLLANAILHAHAWGPPERESRLKAFLVYYDLKSDQNDQGKPLDEYHAACYDLNQEAQAEIAIPG